MPEGGAGAAAEEEKKEGEESKTAAAPEEEKKEEIPDVKRPSNSYVPKNDEATEKIIHDKLIAKLLEYNQKLNGGKEIRVVDFLKKINANSPFLHKFENQKHMRRAFFEEYKVHSFNYTLLLFDSIIRLLNTTCKQEFSDNFRKFLASRGKMLGPGIVSCVGWDQVLRCIQVIEMAMRDLIYKIVPTKIVVKQLLTSKGKILN